MFSANGEAAKFLGVVGNVLAGISAFTQYKSNPTAGNAARLAVTGIGIGANAIPFVGTVLSIGIGLADQAGAFEGIYHYLDRVHK